MAEFNNIRFIFKTEINDFREFEGVFHDLHKLQLVHERYISEMYEIKPENFEQSNLEESYYSVYYISKNSPLDIGVYIQKYWKEFIIIATFIANYKRLKESLIDINDDVNKIIDEIEKLLKDVTRDFPEFEKKIIADFVKWFISKTVEDRAWIVSRYRYIRESLSKLTEIFPENRNK